MKNVFIFFKLFVTLVIANITSLSYLNNGIISIQPTLLAIVELAIWALISTIFIWVLLVKKLTATIETQEKSLNKSKYKLNRMQRFAEIGEKASATSYALNNHLTIVLGSLYQILRANSDKDVYIANKLEKSIGYVNKITNLDSELKIIAKAEDGKEVKRR